MRQDQLERMRSLQERLADRFFVELGDKPGAAPTIALPELDTAQNRGDCYWLKKNALSTLTLIGRIENLLALRDGRASGGPNPDQVKDDEAQLDKEIAQAEREAAELGRNVVRIHAGKKGRR